MSKVTNITSDLEKLGLSPNEIRVYLAAITLGTCDIRQLSKETNLKRTTTYSIVETLVQKGALTTTKQSNGTLVKTVKPRTLLAQRREAIDRLETSLEQLRLTAHYEPTLGETTIYKGREAIEQLHKEILVQEKSILIFGDGEGFLASHDSWAANYMSIREKNGIRAKILLKHNPQKKRYAHNRPGSLTEIRALPPGFQFRGGFDVLEKKVIIYSFDKEQLAIVIEHPSIVSLLRAMHLMLWQLGA